MIPVRDADFEARVQAALPSAKQIEATITEEEHGYCAHVVISEGLAGRFSGVIHALSHDVDRSAAMDGALACIVERRAAFFREQIDQECAWLRGKAAKKRARADALEAEAADVEKMLEGL